MFQQISSQPPKLLVNPHTDLMLKPVAYDINTNQTSNQRVPTPPKFGSLGHRNASLRVSAYTKQAALLDSSNRDQYQYFFDHEFGFGRGVKVADLTFIAVSPWKYTPEGYARWAGLMVERMEVDSEIYERRGVFIGPRVEEQLQGWERQTFTLR